jgi:hypothetical protein
MNVEPLLKVQRRSYAAATTGLRAAWPDRLEAEWLRRHGHAPEWAVAFAELRPERVFSHAAD